MKLPQFSLRAILELTAAVSVVLAMWRQGVVSHHRGREEMYLEFISTGVLERPSYGATVPLEGRMNMHVITNWKPKPGKAIVEIWDCTKYPVLLRSVDVDVTPGTIE
jgi:hypothetical protein